MSKLKNDPGYRGGWCIHYRYNRDLKGAADTCEAGVPYEQFAAAMQHKPCFLDAGKSKPGALHCEHLRLPTPEEIVAHDAWLAVRLDRMGVVMTGILPWRKAHKGQNAAEVVECPACKGRLRLSIAAYNSHIHGRCETPDCVSWVE